MPAGPRRLVGRVPELTLLTEAVAAVRAGLGDVLVVTGPAGVGKSALVATTAQQALAGGIPARWGSVEQENATPLAVVRDALGLGLGLAHPPSDPASPSLPNPLAAATEELLAHVDDLLAAGPLLVVLDDLQWADAASLEAWRELAGTAGREALLLVGVVRTPATASAPASASPVSLAGEAGRVVDLGPLPPDEVQVLVGHLLGEASPPWLDDVVAVTDGNPLYVTELVAALRYEGRAAGGDGSRPGVPATLTEAVTARVGVLTPPVTTLVRSAALLGSSLAVDELTAVLRQPPGEVAAAAAAAVEAGVLLPDGDERLRFRHDLLRAAVRDAVPQALRSAMHEDIAQILAPRGAPVLRVAEHLAQGPTPLQRRSVEWLLPVAPTLLHRAPHLAAGLVEAALAGLTPDDPRRGATVLLLAGAKLRDNRPDAAADLLTALLRGDPPDWLRTESRWMLAFARLALGEPGAATAVLAAELGTATDAGEATPPDTAPAAGGTAVGAAGATGEGAAPGLDAGRRWSFLALSAWAHLAEGRTAEARRESSAVLAALPIDHPTAAFAAATAGVAAMVEDSAAEGLPVLDAAAAAGRTRGTDPTWDDPRHHVLHAAGWTLLALDRCDDAEQRLDEGLRIAERGGGILLPSLHAAAAQHRYLTGRWDESLDQVTAGLRAPSVYASHGMLRSLASLVSASRDLTPGQGAGSVDGIHPDAAGGDDPAGAAPALAAWSFAQWAAYADASWAERSGEPRRALERLAGQVHDPAHRAFPGAYVMRPAIVRLALAAGERERARDEAAAARADAARQATPGRQAGADWCDGLLASDPRLLLRAARRYRSAGYHPLADRALEDAAVTLAAAGRPVLARPPARRAADGYAGRGAAWDQARLQHRLRAHGLTVPPLVARGRPATGWDGLSPTERAVAGLVAEGLSNPQIADRMLVARRTVATHVSRVLHKLGLRSRTEIAAELARRQAAPG